MTVPGNCNILFVAAAAQTEIQKGSKKKPREWRKVMAMCKSDYKGFTVFSGNASPPLYISQT
jgi:hypothetical protein